VFPPHTTPHPPQFLLSLLESDSQPLAELPSQSPNPWLHCRTPHWLLMQPATALGREQTLPHAPQLLRSFETFFSHPLPRFLSQSAKPMLHDPMPHLPAAQPGVPLVTAPHMVPHEPQLATSVCKLISHPSFRFLLQSPKPCLQIP